MRVPSACLLFIFLATRVNSARLVGGWRHQNPLSNPRFFELAHFALSGENKGHGIPGAAIKLRSVATQVVAGIKYKIEFDLVPLVCSSNKVPRQLYDGSYRGYGSLLCVMGVKMNTCTTVIYEVPWRQYVKVTALQCYR
ncbi:cystatin-2-like [Haemaphysalis longicornis]